MTIFLKKLSFNIIIVAFLVISIFTVYSQVRNFEFINFDDPKYIIDNNHVKSGITISNIKWAFSFDPSKELGTYYHPLTWMSHMMDVQLFHLNPGMHHIMNLFFHIINSLLLFFLIWKMTHDYWKSLFIAAMFGLHPVNVDSVAWIAERKSLLSTFFWLLTLLSYWYYIKKPDIHHYILTLFIFVCGLLTKPIVVTLPFIMLLLDYWPLNRCNSYSSNEKLRKEGAGIKNLILEKIPFLVLGLILLGVSSYSTINRYIPYKTNPLDLRIAHSIISYVIYIGKLFLPLKLAIHHPYPPTVPLWHVIGSILILGGFSIFVIITRKRYPFLIVGWLWYLATLLPVIGIIQVGLWPSYAERWAYIPYIGIFIIITWGLTVLFRQWGMEKYFLVFSFLVIIPILMWVTAIQVSYWKDSITLFTHTLNVTENNDEIHSDIAVPFIEKNDLEASIFHLNEALKINPNCATAHSNLGVVLTMEGKSQEAIGHFEQAIRIKPELYTAHYNLGRAFYFQNRIDESIQELNETLVLNNQHEDAKKLLELALIKKRQIDNIIAKMKENLRIDPKNAELNYSLAEVYLSKGDTNNAINYYEKSLLINPNQLQVLNTLAVLYSHCGEYDNALNSLQKIVVLKPNDPDVYYNMACIFSRQRKNDDAIHALKQAINYGFRRWDILKKDADLENIRQMDFYRSLMH